MYICDMKRSDKAPEAVAGTQAVIYKLLRELAIPFERIDCEPTITMEDCRAIDRELGCSTVKSVFLRNRQGTAYYLYVTDGEKPFVTRDFCGSLGVPRVSFASAEEMQKMLGVEHGAATPLAIAADDGGVIRMVADTELLSRDYVACPDGTTTCYMRLSASELFERFIPATSHELTLI